MSSPRRRRVRSFAMKQLLAETPHSNRTRLAYRLKRSPFSSRGSRRGVVCSRQQLRRHGVEVLKARRCLDVYSCVGEAEGPLTVTEAVPLAEIHALDVVKSPGPESLFVNFVRVVQDTYPQILKSQIISSPCNEAMYYWLELVPPTLVFDPSVGPINCVRMMLSSEGLCSLQVLLPLVRTVWKRKYMCILS